MGGGACLRFPGRAERRPDFSPRSGTAAPRGDRSGLSTPTRDSFWPHSPPRRGLISPSEAKTAHSSTTRPLLPKTAIWATTSTALAARTATWVIQFTRLPMAAFWMRARQGLAGVTSSWCCMPMKKTARGNSCSLITLTWTPFWWSRGNTCGAANRSPRSGTRMGNTGRICISKCESSLRRLSAPVTVTIRVAGLIRPPSSPATEARRKTMSGVRRGHNIRLPTPSPDPCLSSRAAQTARDLAVASGLHEQPATLSRCTKIVRGEHRCWSFV